VYKRQSLDSILAKMEEREAKARSKKTDSAKEQNKGGGQ